MASRTALDNALRNSITTKIFDLLKENFDDVGYDKDNILSFPCLDSENNERCATVTISIPKGSRDGEEYDCYEAHKNYLHKKEEDRKKKEKREVEKQAKIKRDEAYRKKKKEEKEKGEEEA